MPRVNEDSHQLKARLVTRELQYARGSCTGLHTFELTDPTCCVPSDPLPFLSLYKGTIRQAPREPVFPSHVRCHFRGINSSHESNSSAGGLRITANVKLRQAFLVA